MTNVLLFLIFVVTFIFFYAKHKYSYWKRKGVAYLTPIFPIGNEPLSLPKGLSFGLISKKYYDQFKPTGCRLGGVYFGFEPNLVIMDPKYMEDVLKTDFSHFIDRGTYYNKSCPLTVNIFTQPGNEWRATRAKFSNMFTNSKMKILFETFKACNEELEEYLAKCVLKDEYTDILNVMSCYNTDIIGSVVYGVECKSFKDAEDSAFRQIGNSVFRKHTLSDRLQMYLALYHQTLARFLGVTNVQKGVWEFFLNVLKDSIEYREKNNVGRMDFVQILIDSSKSQHISLEDMTAQTFLFFIAGYETASNTSAYLLFELALHQDIQQQIREEIIHVLEKYDNNIRYETLKEMPLLDRAYWETLRKYPASGTILRQCVKDYTFRDSNLTIPKGMKVLCPLFSYHRDLDYFPDPVRWNPDRFLNPEAKHLGLLPFGDGPRNCIGMNFGTTQVKMGAISVLKNYKITADPNIKLPLEFDSDTFLLYSTQKLKLKLHKLDE